MDFDLGVQLSIQHVPDRQISETIRARKHTAVLAVSSKRYTWAVIPAFHQKTFFDDFLSER